MTRVIRFGLSFMACVAVATFAWAADEKKAEEEPAVTLKVGDKAPDFALPAKEDAPEGAPKKLSDFLGKKNVVLAFYPKADTPGCTKQLCGYRDKFETFQSGDTEIIAISIDPQEASDAFKAKFSMQFTVLGDTSGAIVKSYGVPVKQYGDNAIAQRSIFVVDKAGLVQYIDMEYNIAEDEKPLLDAIGTLGEGEKKAG
ncbi:MAG: peroxiredoxin [Candidatus Hydrogenedentota bacterium]